MTVPLAGNQSLRVTRGAGLLLAAAAFPHVWVALEALRELGGRRPDGFSFLDYQTYAWSRCAFVLAHFWLGLSLRQRQHLMPATIDGVLIAAVAAELLLVWAISAWLGLLGWGLLLW